MLNLSKAKFSMLVEYGLHIAAHQRTVERLLELHKIATSEDFRTAYAAETKKLRKLTSILVDQYSPEVGLDDRALSALLRGLQER